MDGQSIRPPSLPGDLSSSETSHTSKHTREIVHAQDESSRHATTFAMLTDNVLLDIFDFYRNRNYSIYPAWTWHVLVHVCQRWRQIIFESPLRLKLQILCTEKTPVPKILDVWPASFPITIYYLYKWGIPLSNDEEDNIIAALEHRDRVCCITLFVIDSQLAKMVTVMQAPFPVLTRLDIRLFKQARLLGLDVEAPVLPDEFLGASAPCLQELQVHDIPYPALPTLLSSTNGLVTLRFCVLPRGYISPEAMVVGLAGLPKLETLDITFKLTFPHPNHIRLPPVTRIVLPGLTSFQFMGASEYLESLVAQMDGPQLSQIWISYWDQVVDIRVAQLSKFVNHSGGPKLTQFNHAAVRPSFDSISFTMSYFHLDFHPKAMSSFISFQGQASNIAGSLGQISATEEMLSNVIHLHLDSDIRPSPIADDIEWLHLLRRFPAVQSLQVSQEYAERIALALDNITGEMVTVLPSLNLIYLEGLSASSAGRFVAARELSDRPVTVVDTIAEFGKALESSVSKYQIEAMYYQEQFSRSERSRGVSGTIQ